MPPENPPSAPSPPAKAASSESEGSNSSDRQLEETKQRLQREWTRELDAARSQLIVKIFPVLDSLDRSVALETDAGDVIEGIKLVRTQLLGVLEELGVQRIESVGKPFDPRHHEAVSLVEVDEPSLHDRVVEEWGAGYRHGDRLLRPARVSVGKRGAHSTPAF